jgi:hypothetical protein
MRNVVLSTDFHRINEKIIIKTKQSVASLAQISCSPVSRTGEIISKTIIAIASETIIMYAKRKNK